ncbi:hypothetical protein EFT43_03925 [Leuconostoc falkenbergense]|uniref:hypothetical protein n=1 Tax=Leuconostoc falkenbergense TaxID=2766470 RepID=UPI001664C8F5|nr:hypothetical protein [Leuconostoc falkenbergense]MCT4404077.1 hypothetical protein [Leuconostoc falkenbergense]
MYDHFTPGRNIWKKVSRWMFFTMERIFVLVIVFGITYLMIKSFYPYNIGKYGLILIMSNALLAGYLILPSPSNPMGLMYQEILRGILKSSMHATGDLTAITENKKREEK